MAAGATTTCRAAPGGTGWMAAAPKMCDPRRRGERPHRHRPWARLVRADCDDGRDVIVDFRQGKDRIERLRRRGRHSGSGDLRRSPRRADPARGHAPAGSGRRDGGFHHGGFLRLSPAWPGLEISIGIDAELDDLAPTRKSTAVGLPEELQWPYAAPSVSRPGSLRSPPCRRRFPLLPRRRWRRCRAGRGEDTVRAADFGSFVVGAAGFSALQGGSGEFLHQPARVSG